MSLYYLQWMMERGKEEKKDKEKGITQIAQ
jgi:hypothetical protein